jgi:hypothetical protein
MQGWLSVSDEALMLMNLPAAPEAAGGLLYSEMSGGKNFSYNWIRWDDGRE